MLIIKTQWSVNCVHNCLDILYQSWGGGYYASFSIELFSLFIKNYQNTSYPYNITFLFDRCPCISAAVTPDKYERDSKYLTYTLPNKNFP